MANSEHLSTTTTTTYRLLDREGSVIDEQELPTDGEALAWAEQVKRHRQPRVFIRRVERHNGDDWEYVTAPGDY